MFLGSITADGYLSAFLAVAMLVFTTVFGRRAAWRTGVEKKLQEQEEHLVRHDRKFQCLRDRHGLDTTIID
jgi:hypothetical protein